MTASGGQSGSSGATGGSANSTGGTGASVGNGGSTDFGNGGTVNGSQGGSGNAGGLGGTQQAGNGGTVQGPPPSGGSCNDLVSPSATGGCTDGSVSVLYTNRSNAVAFNQMTMTLGLENGGADFALTDLVLRYWFNADGQSNFTGEVDYASASGPDIRDSTCVQFGDQLGSAFADIAFTAAETVGADGVDQVQLRIHTDDFAELDQSNDFSFLENGDGAANANITVYVAGTRVAGCEPE